MTEEQLKKNLARNLTELRKAHGITQSELGEKLTYSDKSISKWERGDGLPDLLVLNKLSEIYGITINDIIGDDLPKISENKPKKPHLSKRIIIPLMAVGLVFLVASLAFFAVKIAGVQDSKMWLIFLYALPIAFIPSIVFTCIWWGVIPRAVCVSGLIWSLVVCLRMTFNIQNMNFIFISAAIFQFLVILWFILRWITKRVKNK